MMKEVLLIVSILMPGQKPDIQHQVTGLTMEECFEQAKDFIGHELTDAMREHGAIGYSATCMWREKPSMEN